MKKLLVILLLMPLTVCALEVPSVSTVLPGYYEQDALKKYESSYAGDLEGLWYYPDEDMTLAIERINSEKDDHNETYRIIVAGSDDCAVDLGSIAGYIEKSAAPDEMNIWLYSAFNGEYLTMPVKCLAKVDADFKTILLKKPKVKFRFSVNLLHFLPTIFSGVRLYPTADRPKSQAGFRRVEQKSEPIYF